MTANDNDAFDRLIRKLDRLNSLDQTDRAAIRSLPIKTRTAPPHQHLVREGEKATDCCLLIAGYACR